MSTNLYEITADYRPNNPNKPKYYVVASSKKEARDRFERRISWLKVYNIELMAFDEANKIVNDPAHYIIIS